MVIKCTPFKQKDCQVGRGGVDRASSSDAQGPEFEPWPLNLKKQVKLGFTRACRSIEELGIKWLKTR